MDISLMGQTITVGLVASWTLEGLKRFGLFDDIVGKKLLLRAIVAAACVGLSLTSSVLNGSMPGWETLFESLLSYMVAAANYDHVFKQ